MPRPGRHGPQGHALIQLHVPADHRGLAHHDAGAVIDKEVGPDGRAGVDIDARAAVGIFGHDPGDHGHPLAVQQVGNAIDKDGEQARIGKDDLLLVGGGGVAVERGLDVRQQHLLDAGQLRHDGLGDLGGLSRLAVRQSQGDLGRHPRFDAFQQQRGIVLCRKGHQLRVAEIGGEEKLLQKL